MNHPPRTEEGRERCTTNGRWRQSLAARVAGVAAAPASICGLLSAILVLAAYTIRAAEHSDFAISVVEHSIGEGNVTVPHRGAKNAAGRANYTGINRCKSQDACTFVSLGHGGHLVLTLPFRRPSGKSRVSLHIYEAGSRSEPYSVYVSTDRTRWLAAGEEVKGSARLLLPQEIVDARPPAIIVRIVDASRPTSPASATAGVDIDAVALEYAQSKGQAKPKGQARKRSSLSWQQYLARGTTGIIAWAQGVGGSPIAPGNTIFAARQSELFPFHGIEVDIVVTKDLVPVAFHDRYLEKRTNGKGIVKNHTIAELQTYRRGKWKGNDVPIPRLRHFLREISPGRLLLFDVKVREATQLAAIGRVASEFESKHPIYVSMYSARLSKVATHFPPSTKFAFKTYDSIVSIRKSLLEALSEAGFSAFMIQITGDNKGLSDLVKNAHKVGLQVITFVDGWGYPPGTLQEMFDLKVDFILSRRLEIFD